MNGGNTRDQTYWAVRKGRIIGLVFSLEEVEKATKNFPGAEFKGFTNVDDARVYLDGTDPDFAVNPSDIVLDPTGEVMVYAKDSDDAIETMSRSSARSVSRSSSKADLTEDLAPKDLKQMGLEQTRFDVNVKFICLSGVEVTGDAPGETFACTTRFVMDDDIATPQVGKYYYGSEPIKKTSDKGNVVSWIEDKVSSRVTNEAQIKVDLSKSNVNRSSESVDSINAFIPTMLNVEVGTMKYGANEQADEFIVLGDTSFSISGGEKKTGVLYDLSVRPRENATHEVGGGKVVTVTATPKKRGLLKKLGIKKDKSTPETETETEVEEPLMSIKLGKSSILRLKVEVKPSYSIGPIIPKMLDQDQVSDDEKSQFEMVDENVHAKQVIEARRKVLREKVDTPTKAKKPEKMKKVKPKEKKAAEKEEDRKGLFGLLDNLRDGCVLIAGDLGIVQHDFDDEFDEKLDVRKDMSEFHDVACISARQYTETCGKTCDGKDTLSDSDDSSIEIIVKAPKEKK
uniref:Ribonuclease H1 N-terminal domain-containing protein n=1 Tax=Leptocylindrus danicus TaxID=163516 RepID=A0A7S2LSX3_9STRA|mmetsp:Transcript_9579/g.14389  ORF Transcript_9579/g.14389 Transcript_9579/m.14389 type:complete len:512 (+) Transcript_9579:100-1635(+)|eukprot:CAMPEP_0116013316 /NCGR_PEP_ID=MMETSP0321-20121206/5658_1 /TAXON_ID=163516 /ORGANISM="Leptocylindrus danicus var. danicus, Strain B650" /LENGTH=511 /DNA_ID=CAMNT_0003482851 /DNA_START=41 /DNA_END=1576 /DNA_ORIENTATION=+